MSGGRGGRERARGTAQREGDAPRGPVPSCYSHTCRHTSGLMPCRRKSRRAARPRRTTRPGGPRGGCRRSRRGGASRRGSRRGGLAVCREVEGVVSDDDRRRGKDQEGGRERTLGVSAISLRAQGSPQAVSDPTRARTLQRQERERERESERASERRTTPPWSGSSSAAAHSCTPTPLPHSS